jgi:nucleoporin NUP145
MVSAKVGNAVANPHGIVEGEYYTVPPLHSVASVASVANFVIVRKGYGSISFNEPVDLTGISSLSSLQEIVKINRGSVSVYPNESEPVPPGTGLNIPAQVSLINIFPPSGIEPQFYMRQLQSKSHTEFVFYNSDTGI